MNHQKLEALAQATIDLNLANGWDWVAVMEDAKLGRTHTEFGLAANPATILALLGQIKQLQAERDEADRAAGEAMRTKQDLIDYKRRVSTWMQQTTVDLGQSRNMPFDQAFNILLQERNQLKSENERLRKLPTCWREVIEQSEANDQLLDEVLALSADAERYRFVLASKPDGNGDEAPGIYFSEADGGGMSMALYGQDATDAIDAARGALPGRYRCHVCNDTTPDPAEGNARVGCACGAIRDSEAFALQAFAWLYALPGPRDVQIHLSKQHYPGNWVENGGYTVTPLYTGPVNGDPAGWAYRVKLGAKPTSWRVSVTEPCFSGDPGDIEVMPLYKGISVTGEVPA